MSDLNDETATSSESTMATNSYAEDLGSKIMISDKYSIMKNWTLKELKILRLEINNGNLENIRGLQEKILTKSEQEIRDAILFLKEEVSKLITGKPQFSVNKKYKKNEYKETITKWLDLMASSNNIYDLTVNVKYSDAILQLAQTVPPANACEGVDFKNILIYLGKALRGELLPTLDEKTQYVFNEAFKATVKCALRELKYNEDLVSFLKNLSPGELAKLPQEVDTNKEDLFAVISQNKYNPLKIPLYLLKPKSDVFYDSDND